MTVEIYTAIKEGLLTLKDVNNKPIFKCVKMFFNDIEREIGKVNTGDPFLKPACLIQFQDISCTDMGDKARVQQCNFNTILHLVWDIRLKDDTALLAAKQKVYVFMQTLELTSIQPSSSRFLRVAEVPQPDYDTLIVYQQIYKSTFKDNSAQSNITGTVANMSPVTVVVQNHIP